MLLVVWKTTLLNVWEVNVNKLWQFEWRKIWRQKSLYICFGIGLIINLLGAIAIKVLGASSTACLAMCTALNSGFIALLGIYLAIYACHDHTHQTLKCIYARGYQRTKVYFTKYLISLCITMLMAVIYLAFNFLITLLLNGNVGSLDGLEVQVLLLQFWTLFGFHGMFFGVGMMVGKIAGSLALNLIGIEFCFAILSTIFMILKINFDIIQLSLQSVFDSLSVAIFEGFVIGLLLRSILIPLCYVVLFVGGGWWINQRRDV